VLVIGSFGEFSSWQMQVHARPLSCNGDIPLLSALVLSGPAIPRNQLARPLATISLWDFLTLISVSDFDILACTVIQIGRALEKNT